MVDLEQLKKLREETAVSLADCRKALDKAKGDTEKAKEILREMGKDLANKRVEKETKSGLVHCYLHPNEKMGVLIEVRCETDFVAKSEGFNDLVHELCLQIAAMKPLYVSEEDIPQEVLDKEKEIYKEQFKDSKKPENLMGNIIDGKVKKYKEEAVLMLQPWIKDNAKTINDLFNEFVSKVGENIKVKKFTRYEI
ncbi:MAG: elongation factor Ts [Candidatus Pacebacteria bacterium]|nr:elongation factor Ts [Candidatus Paceibacterota bacterium]